MRFTGGKTGSVWIGAALSVSLIGLAAAGAPPRTRSIAAAHQTPSVREEGHRAPSQAASPTQSIAFRGAWSHTYNLRAGEPVEISVHLDSPSTLPPNARIAAEWHLDSAAASAPIGWRKVLHALDSDLFLIYRAPVSGAFTLKLTAVEQETPVGDAAPRWRERGNVTALAPLPASTPWVGSTTPISVTLHRADIGTAGQQAKFHTLIESEPNDSPEYAQTIVLDAGDDVRTWEIAGTADDIEYFDNGKVGASGMDWYRIEFKGAKPALMTAQLGIPDQTIAARIRCFRATGPTQPAGFPPKPIAMQEHLDGQNGNERPHQQEEPHRSMISRLLKPGETYFLQVEANAPGYQLQLRTLPPAPYADPTMAVRQGIYQQIGQVDAWLTNRPRGASVERRIRESGNLLGTQCMSCHTQSGVWGPAGAVLQGYRIENPQNFQHLIDVMYECLRPTNVLKDAANNTSLAPLDIGDGPAGTRAAGFNIVNLERIQKPSRLHARQQIRTANYVLQTGDPGGINAAGPGSNVGQAIVCLFSTEILKTAWERTHDPKYFRGMEQRARQMMEINIVYTDDIAVRLDYFARVFPIKDYIAAAVKAAAAEQFGTAEAKTDRSALEKFVDRVQQQMRADEARLLAIQNPDGTWSFSPGSTPDAGKTWVTSDRTADPSPSALAVTALTSLGHDLSFEPLARGVKGLLALQEPSGRWNRAAQTGFVSTAYAIHALARLYPVKPVKPARAAFLPQRDESVLQTLNRVQRIAQSGDGSLNDLLPAIASHSSVAVRCAALIGLGAFHDAKSVPTIRMAMSDRAKPVREAAVWAMKQELLDDHGWNETLDLLSAGSDDARLSAIQALGLRADAVMPKASVNWTRLAILLDRAMNHDPHPGVRAWAAKAAWQWWVWNPPIRKFVNASWQTLLTRMESNALVENANRYSSQMLFIVNGHKANGSGEHQYKELAQLFADLNRQFDAETDSTRKRRFATRLAAIGGTFFQTAGGDGGPGQMGYATPGSGELIGKAALYLLQDRAKAGVVAEVRAAIEGGANVPYQPLTAFLVDYSLKGPEEVRQLAASSVSDPRSVSLAGVPELVEPQLLQILRGAQEPPRRAQLSDPILDLWAKVNWNIPKQKEQQKAFFDLVIPKLSHYVSPEEVQSVSDTAKRAALEKEMTANWYLAERLGDVLQANPDLHLDIVLLDYFPVRALNPLEEAYWLRNVEWMLTYNPSIMEKLLKGKTAAAARAAAPWLVPVALQTPAKPADTAPDPIVTVKDRVLQLYLDQLKPTANPRTRAAAIRMANQTALRQNPEVLRALGEALPGETAPDLRSIIQNVLNQSSSRFLPDLMAELKREHDPSVKLSAAGEPQLSKPQLDDIVYFRDYVMPELNRQKRTDQQACIGCHGLPGRVPSLYLKAPDKYGYSTVADLLYNYRTLQKKVVLTDIEKSKLLRKPLNIQDGKEDGHQGGRRFSPSDPGYLVLRKWVENQPAVAKPAE